MDARTDAFGRVYAYLQQLLEQRADEGAELKATAGLSKALGNKVGDWLEDKSLDVAAKLAKIEKDREDEKRDRTLSEIAARQTEGLARLRGELPGIGLERSRVTRFRRAVDARGELGADVAIAKAGALVHDIGKALDHEVQGTHIDIGIRILQKFKADPRIITAMKSHHDDTPHESIESVIVQTADHISGGRPGARRDSVENYIKRLQELEALATSFEGDRKSVV